MYSHLNFDIEVYSVIGDDRQIAVANDILAFDGLYTIEEIKAIYNVSLIINTFNKVFAV